MYLYTNINERVTSLTDQNVCDGTKYYKLPAIDKITLSFNINNYGIK